MKIASNELGGVQKILEQKEAELPPFSPAQLHAHGPVPVTSEGLPAEQRSAARTGGLLKGWLLAAPQEPFVGAT